MVRELNDANFKETIQSGTTVVDFWAPWCGPCRMLGPVLEEVSEELGEKATFTKINVDENPVSAREYKISSIPCVMIFKNGEVVETLVGFRPKQDFVAAVEKHL